MKQLEEVIPDGDSGRNEKPADEPEPQDLSNAPGGGTGASGSVDEPEPQNQGNEPGGGTGANGSEDLARQSS